MKEFFGSVGSTAGFLFTGIHRLFTLLTQVLGGMFASLYTPKLVKPRHLFKQIVLMGWDSCGIISLVGIAVGMVLALQAGYQLQSLGATLYTGGLVAVTVTRELGPLVAAIIITGRIGARMAAELGSMKVAEEIDALTTMGLNPIRYLVIPRTLSMLIVLPCLTLITDIMGMVGGFLIGVFAMGINPFMYISVSFDALVLPDIFLGLIKSVVFAMIVALISCHQGLSVEGGADGVGKSTTEAVVTSVTMIIILDVIVTGIFMAFFPA